MLNYKKWFGIVVCAASIFAASAADRFQVTYLKGADEPRVSKVINIEATAALFAQRLSQTLKQEIKVVPFEKAEAQTLFVITREKTAGGEYAKCLQGKPGDSFIIRYPVDFKGKKNVCLLMPCGFQRQKECLSPDVPGRLGLLLPRKLFPAQISGL